MSKRQKLFDRKNITEQVNKFEEALNYKELDRAVDFSRDLSNRRIRDVLIRVIPENILPFLREMEWARAGKIIAWLPEELTLELIQQMQDGEQEELFSHLDNDEVVDLLDHLSVERRDELLRKLNPDQEKDVKELSVYDPESAGGHMETEYVTTGPETKVAEALDKLKQARNKIQNTDYIYVTDKDNKLLGIISAQEISFASRESTVDKIMNKNIHVARVDDSVEEAARTLRYRRFSLLPVVNNEDQLVGVLTLDTAIDQLSEELAEDLGSIGGTSAEESFFTPSRSAIKMRLPWMAVNVFLNLGAVAVISGFEATIAQIAILAAFLPMITDMGGNVGIQALSVSIRSIALGDVQLGDIWRVLRKEFSIGIVNGLALGGLFAVLAIILEGVPLLGAVAGIALFTNVLVAGIVGGTFPFLIKKLGKDPAMMTGPFLTTITDITGVTIYLGLSTLLLLG